MWKPQGDPTGKNQKQCLVLVAAVLLALPAALGFAEDRIPIDGELARSAQIWLDGVPLLPPHTTAIVDDTVLTVNGRTVLAVSPALMDRPESRTPRISRNSSPKPTCCQP